MYLKIFSDASYSRVLNVDNFEFYLAGYSFVVYDSPQNKRSRLYDKEIVFKEIQELPVFNGINIEFLEAVALMQGIKYVVANYKKNVIVDFYCDSKNVVDKINDKIRSKNVFINQIINECTIYLAVLKNYNLQWISRKSNKMADLVLRQKLDKIVQEKEYTRTIF